MIEVGDLAWDMGLAKINLEDGRQMSLLNEERQPLLDELFGIDPWAAEWDNPDIMATPDTWEVAFGIRDHEGALAIDSEYDPEELREYRRQGDGAYTYHYVPFDVALAFANKHGGVIS